ncbi:MAG: 16S rRNA (cytidine(1402)-2'-O)-methyltransferase [Candidatus Omnitrophica bacterium]|nr:16S rRNA (cytidine(1402)-2'-O)-methyltransferase [Candidatus Omnitrophota bacterium]
MLYIVATPIGNLEDITFRGLRILGQADYILAEDTRKTARLLKHNNISKPLVSFFEHNELKKIPSVIKDLKQNKNIVLVSNAGTPAISDPGYKLIRECSKENLPLTSIPGPSAPINALVLSALASDKFIFLGFLPRKKSKALLILKKAAQLKITTIIFESPFRTIKTLKNIQQEFKNPKVAVVREMTKLYEEVISADIQEVIARLEQKPLKGEVTIVINNSFVCP